MSILGAGPAGSAAAIAALSEGAAVRLIEKSVLPRHKVCGEFVSGEAAELLERLGVWDDFMGAGPARMRRMLLHIGRFEKSTPLPQLAFGLSRYSLDHLLFRKAVSVGAELVRETGGPAQVIARGRLAGSRHHGDRVFGFKAHFTGPIDDAVELLFFEGGYAGVSPVENGRTNVCGLALETVLAAHHFEPDSLLAACEPLAVRLKPLTRAMKWLIVGPLSFQHRFDEDPQPGVYPAGDALCFVDPFTGSGILAALATGRLAGIAVTRRTPAADYLRQCRRALAIPFQCATLFRRVLEKGWAERLGPLMPGQWLYQLTRPRLNSL